MNSTLQALLHTPKFISLFLNKETAKHINLYVLKSVIFHVHFGCCRNNELGTKGAISGCFSALSDMYWSGKYSIIQPSIFRVREIVFIFMYIILFYIQDFRKYLPVT